MTKLLGCVHVVATILVLASCTEAEPPATTRVVRDLARAIADGDAAAARDLLALDGAASDAELARALSTQGRFDPDALEVFGEHVVGDHLEARVRVDGRESPRTLVFVEEGGTLRFAPSGQGRVSAATAPKWWVGNDRGTVTGVYCSLAGDFTPQLVGHISPWTSQEEFCPTWICGILGSQCSRFGDAAQPGILSVTCVNQWFWLDADYFVDPYFGPSFHCIGP
jgi:hypothetical protein